MVSSPFTPAQQNILQSFLSGYLAKGTDKEKGQHLDAIINEIVMHEVFKGKLSFESKSEGDWKKVNVIFCACILNNANHSLIVNPEVVQEQAR